MDKEQDHRAENKSAESANTTFPFEEGQQALNGDTCSQGWT